MMHHNPDDAFAIAPEDQIVLRVLSGVQSGAEIDLRPAPYVLGSGEDADIVLSDGSLKSGHVAVTVGKSGVTLEARDGPAMVAGQVVAPGGEVAVEVPSAIVVGLLVIGIGSKKTDWTTVDLPDPVAAARAMTVRESEPEEGVAGEDEAGESAPDAEAADDGGEITADAGEGDEAGDGAEDGHAGESPVTDEAPEAAEVQEAAPRRRRAGLVWLAAAVVFCLAGAGAVQFGMVSIPDWSGDDTAAAAAEVADPVEAVRGVLDELGLDTVTVTTEPGVGTVVSGMVDSLAERDALRGALAEAGIDVVDRVRVVEQMLNAINTTLSAVRWPSPNYEDHLEVRHLGAGRFVIDGYLGPQVDRSELHRRIELDVPSIVSLSFERADLRYWQADLAGRIDAAGLSDWLTVSPAGADLRVEGELTATQAREWRAVGEAFVEASRGRPLISIGVTAMPDPVAPAPDPDIVAPDTASGPVVETPAEPVAPKRPDITIIGVIISGPTKIALLSDGTRVREGEPLETGETVKEVAIDRVVITSGGTEMVFKVEDKK